MPQNTAQVSYVWVNNNAKKNETNEIPCTEEDHGLKNIIANAIKTPKAKHVLYLDRLTDGETTFDSSIKLPNNVEFKTVDSLFEDTSALMKENKVENHEQLIANMREIYEAEMKFGKPAFAGNVVKLLAIYRGGMVTDIGVGFGERVVNDLNNYERNLRDATSIARIGTFQCMHLPHGSERVIEMMNILYSLYTTNYDGLDVENMKARQVNITFRIVGNRPISSDKVSIEEFVKFAIKEQKQNPQMKMQDHAYVRSLDNFSGAILYQMPVKYIEYTEDDIKWTRKLTHIEQQESPSHLLISQKTAPLAKRDILPPSVLLKERTTSGNSVKSFPKQEPCVDNKQTASFLAQSAMQVSLQDNATPTQQSKVAFTKNDGKSSVVNVETESSKLDRRAKNSSMLR